MNTGGYARLSISFLSDSDSIHRKTRMAGDTMTTTDSQNPTRRRPRRARALGVERNTTGAAETASFIRAFPEASRGRSSRRPLGPLANVQEQQRQREDDREEHDDHR